MNKVIKISEPGEYRVEYKSMFNLIESKTVDISSNGIYTIDICIDYISYKKSEYIPILDRLKENEGYSLSFESQGCFHNVKSNKLYFKREKDSYFMIYKNQKRKLSEGEVRTVRYFEIELYEMDDHENCTTRDTYIVRYNGGEFRKIDDSCTWDGGYFLWNTLNIKY